MPEHPAPEEQLVSAEGLEMQEQEVPQVLQDNQDPQV